jgi:D-alanyl-D-alanine carboxypeptidase
MKKFFLFITVFTISLGIIFLQNDQPRISNEKYFLIKSTDLKSQNAKIFEIHSLNPKIKVDKNTSIGNYVPDDLIELNARYTLRKIFIAKRIEKDLINLLEAAEKDNLDVKVVSGYRSYEEQKSLFNYYVENTLRENSRLSRQQAEIEVNKYSARPGHSEHQLGTAVDILSSETNYQFDSNPNLQYVKWLENNSQKFNFIISYHQGNNEYIYEPWHLRWKN